MAVSKKNRYTDKDLERFKKLILQKIDQAAIKVHHQYKPQMVFH